MKTITRQKPFDKILEDISKDGTVFIIGCGTCATLCHTGGIDEVKAMAEKLSEKGKIVSGMAVPPTGCDEMTSEMKRTMRDELRAADVVLVMSCVASSHNPLTISYSSVHSAPAPAGKQPEFDESKRSTFSSGRLSS